MQDTRTGPFILGFNGPPRCGKDTVAKCVADILDSQGATDKPVHIASLVETLAAGSAAILGFNGGTKWYEEAKDKPIGIEGMDITLRQFMIDASEKFLKGQYGKDFWARLLHHRNRAWWDTIPSILLITNIGFSDEVEFLVPRCTDFINVRLDRKDCDFTRDSRGWVAAQQYGGTDIVVTNDDTPEEAAQEVLRIMYKRGWPVL